MMIARARIALVDALHIQSAEFWLRLGEPLQALRELERLSRRARRHPWAEAVFIAAFGTLREPGYFESLGGETALPPDWRLQTRRHGRKSRCDAVRARPPLRGKRRKRPEARW